MKRLAVASLSVALALAFTGCSGDKKTDNDRPDKKPDDKPQTVDVKGTVTVNNKPLPLGKIVFVPRKGNRVEGEVQDGEFSLTGVSIGDNKVSVDTSHIAAEQSQLPALKSKLDALRKQTRQPGLPAAAVKDMQDQIKDTEAKIKEVEAQQPKPYVPIPKKYQSETNTPITVTVAADSKPITIKLDDR